jgi:hypothetical protein
MGVAFINKVTTRGNKISRLNSFKAVVKQLRGHNLSKNMLKVNTPMADSTKLFLVPKTTFVGGTYVSSTITTYLLNLTKLLQLTEVVFLSWQKFSTSVFQQQKKYLLIGTLLSKSHYLLNHWRKSGSFKRLLVGWPRKRIFDYAKRNKSPLKGFTRLFALIKGHFLKSGFQSKLQQSQTQPYLRTAGIYYNLILGGVIRAQYPTHLRFSVVSDKR